MQLARWSDAHVIGMASAYDSSFLEDLGVHGVIDYKKTRFEDRVQDLDVILIQWVERLLKDLGRFLEEEADRFLQSAIIQGALIT